MLRLAMCSGLLMLLVALALIIPATVSAQGEGGVRLTALDNGTFVTVKETTQGDLLSLYKVSGDRIILVDAVINSVKQSSMSVNLPKRYLHRVDVENK